MGVIIGECENIETIGYDYRERRGIRCTSLWPNRQYSYTCGISTSHTVVLPEILCLLTVITRHSFSFEVIVAKYAFKV